MKHAPTTERYAIGNSSQPYPVTIHAYRDAPPKPPAAAIRAIIPPGPNRTFFRPAWPQGGSAPDRSGRSNRVFDGASVSPMGAKRRGRNPWWERNFGTIENERLSQKRNGERNTEIMTPRRKTSEQLKASGPKLLNVAERLTEGWAAIACGLTLGNFNSPKSLQTASLPALGSLLIWGHLPADHICHVSPLADEVRSLKRQCNP